MQKLKQEFAPYSTESFPPFSPAQTIHNDRLSLSQNCFQSVKRYRHSAAAAAAVLPASAT